MRTIVKGVVLIIALLVLAAPADARRRPGWVDGVSKQYPAPEYFTGVGAAPYDKGGKKQVRSWAADRARAELAKTIRTEVRVVTRTDRDVASAPTRRGQKTTATARRQDMVLAIAGEVLEGVEIKATYRDKRDRMFYALAVLDRMAAARRLTKRAERQKAIVSAEMDAAAGFQQEGRLLLAIHHYRMAQDAARELTEIRELVNILKPGPATYEAIDSYEAKLQTIIAGLQKQVRFTVEVAGPAAGVRSQLVAGLARAGYITRRSPAKGITTYRLVCQSDLTPRGTIDMGGEKMTLPIYEAELVCETIDAATDESVGAIDWRASGNAKTVAAAKKDALRQLGDLVKKRIADRLVEIM